MKRFHTLLLAALLSLSFNAFAQYDVTSITTGLSYPVCMDQASDGRFFITLKGGQSTVANNAKVVVYDENGNFLSDFYDFSSVVNADFERGLLGICLDPDFDNNNYVYVYYNHRNPEGFSVVRLTATGNTGSNPLTLLDVNYGNINGNHVGGNIHISPADPDNIYVTMGDIAVSSNSQLLTNPWGKILRVNKTDGSIPTDNPFYDDGDPTQGNDDRIWSYGHRNGFDFTFSTKNDSLYESENGWNTQDEVNLVTKGGNYGWPDCEGFTGTCSDPSFIAPMDIWNSPLPAVTGIIVYDNSLMPEFDGHMLVSDYDDGNIVDFTLNAAGDQVTNRQTVPFSSGGTTDLLQGNNGCIYVIEGGYTTNGKLTRICPVGMSVEELTKESTVTIAPNPASQSTVLTFSSNLSGHSFELLDVVGKVVQTHAISGSTHTLDLAGLPTGVYFIKAYHADGYLLERFVVN